MCKTIKQKVKFRTSPEHIYKLLTDSKLHSKVTGKKSAITPTIGSKFSLCAGRFTGVGVDFATAQRLVLAWRSQDFPVGIYSMAALQLLRTKDGGTELILTHRGVPKHLIPGVEQDWRRLYWENIHKMTRN
jgi:uncharacterized protein YndB with AHSA1/START domain